MSTAGSHAKQWVTPGLNAAEADQLAAALEIPGPAAALLCGRGITSADAARQFLSPRLADLGDPFAMPGMTAAADRLWRAIDGGEPVTVYGDYDADGVTATALLVRLLTRLGADVSAFLPSRLEHGYGLSEAGLDACLAKHSPAVLVTVDCGTHAVGPIERAAAAGIDAVVTDHHELEGPLAHPVALVTPRLEPRPETCHLAGVGVAFKLCHALLKHARDHDRPVPGDLDLRAYLDLVAVGTVADVVPLLGENRILVRHGLHQMDSGFRGAGRHPVNPGLRALARVGGARPPLAAYHVAFIIAPRLNAAGRMAAPDPGLDLLLTEDPAEAARLAGLLDGLNRRRKDTEAAILKDAVAEIDSRFDPSQHYGIVTGRDGWHIGTIGIVASKLCERYSRPAVVVGFGEGGRGRGSCRSVEGLDVVEVLAACSDLLSAYGGHPMAAGFDIERSHFETFCERFNTEFRARLEGRDLRPVQRIDGWIGLDRANDSLFEAVRLLRPFGMGNPTPTWAARGVTLAAPPRVVGKNHLKLQVTADGSTMEAIGFGMSDCALPEGALDLAFQLSEDEFRGVRRLVLRLKDLRASDVQAAGSPG